MRGLYKSSLPGYFPVVRTRNFRNAYYPVRTCPVMQIRWFMYSALILSAIMIIGGCTSAPSPSGTSPPAQEGQQPGQPATMPGPLTLSADSLSPGAVLPEIYTCKGSSASPPVSWSGIPSGTKSLVLILEDPDAPNGLYTHWLVYNIPPSSGELEPGQTNAKVLSNGAQQGENTNGFRGYYPPCPPPGSTHRYIFRLYAADLYFSLPTADRAAINQALSDHTIAKTEFSTTFSR
jgi:Raf kinase inhibitor-like YbhB/YbcL family protein